MFWPKRTCHRLVRLLPLILSFLLLGCGDQQEAPLKVSLDKRAPAADAPVIRKLPDDSLRFGFDPRLNPKEDVSLYQPFLNYLEQQTGLKIATQMVPWLGELKAEGLWLPMNGGIFALIPGIAVSYISPLTEGELHRSG